MAHPDGDADWTPMVNGTTQTGIYWVDASVIEASRPKQPKRVH